MDKMYDAIIVGGGPAGLSAALYLARAKYKVLVLEKAQIGGQIRITADVVNYPGVLSTNGGDLTKNMHEQAADFGAEFASAEVLDLDLSQDIKVVHTTAGDLKALGVIVATGANPRKVGFEGEKEFQGRGVAYCATCDGEFFTGMEVFVIGGGFAAVEESIFLTKFAKKVTMLVRESDFTCAKTVADEIKRYPQIEVHFNSEIIKAGGEQMLSYLVYRNNETGEETRFEAPEGESFGIFVFAGYIPNTAWLKGKIALDEYGYVITDENQLTNVPGVYAAGDLCIKNLRQVVTAVSDGAVAATSMEKTVSALHDKLGLPEFERPEINIHRAEERKQALAQSSAHADESRFISAEIKAQLEGVFAKFDNSVILRAWLDNGEFSMELKDFMGELRELNPKVAVEERVLDNPVKYQPGLEIIKQDGTDTGVIFHAIPGGHEFNSFIIGMYNVAGPGQAVEENIAAKIKGIEDRFRIRIVVSLSCTMCPEVVMGSQRVASLSDKVRAEVYDIQHFPELKQRYKIMSVPCMIVENETTGEENVYFGKKSIGEIVDLLK